MMDPATPLRAQYAEGLPKLGRVVIVLQGAVFDPDRPLTHLGVAAVQGGATPCDPAMNLRLWQLLARLGDVRDIHHAVVDELGAPQSADSDSPICPVVCIALTLDAGHADAMAYFHGLVRLHDGIIRLIGTSSQPPSLTKLVDLEHPDWEAFALERIIDAFNVWFGSSVIEAATKPQRG